MQSAPTSLGALMLRPQIAIFMPDALSTLLSADEYPSRRAGPAEWQTRDCRWSAGRHLQGLIDA